MPRHDRQLLALAVVLAGCGADPAGAVGNPVFVPTPVLDIAEADIAPGLGVIGAVGVDARGTIYLLEMNSGLILRVTETGTVLPPYDTAEDTAENASPAVLLAVAPDGACFATRAWSRRIFVHPGDGQAPYGHEIFDLGESWPDRLQLRAAVDADHRLHLATHGPVGASAAHEASRLETNLVRVADGLVTTVMRTGRPDALPETVDLPPSRTHFVTQGWDVNAAGELAYAAPGGEYAVVIRDGATGAEKVIDLAEHPDDATSLEAGTTFQDRGIDGAVVPRIRMVRWLDADHILVEPTAGIPTARPRTLGTWETVRRDGTSLGRSDILAPLDRAADLVFQRGTLLVVLTGEKAYEAWVSNVVESESRSAGQTVDVGDPPRRRLRCYSLRGLAVSR
jgi:hypothetical protein